MCTMSCHLHHPHSGAWVGRGVTAWTLLVSRGNSSQHLSLPSAMNLSGLGLTQITSTHNSLTRTSHITSGESGSTIRPRAQKQRAGNCQWPAENRQLKWHGSCLCWSNQCSRGDRHINRNFQKCCSIKNYLSKNWSLQRWLRGHRQWVENPWWKV